MPETENTTHLLDPWDRYNQELAGHVHPPDWQNPRPAARYNLVVIDNFSNSKPDVLRRVEQISGRTLTFEEVDIRDRGDLRDVFRHHAIDAVIHFAGLKAVGESVSQPLRHYDNNISGSA